MSEYAKQRIAELKQVVDPLRRVRKAYRNVRQETTRHGKKIFYYRKGNGPRVRLPDPARVDAVTFKNAYTAAMAGERLFEKPLRRPLPTYSLEKGKRGFVYFIRAGDSVKIGFAANVGKRLTAIQTSCPDDAEVLKIIPGTDQTERYFHAHFAHYRKTGEWFLLEGELADFVRVKA